MTEEELLRIGFFKTDNALPGMERAISCLRLWEYYNGVFLRIIVSKYKDIFVVDHIYYESSQSDKLQLELFGNDLSLENSRR
jgi:hypothetical protein